MKCNATYPDAVQLLGSPGGVHITVGEFGAPCRIGKIKNFFAGALRYLGIRPWRSGLLIVLGRIEIEVLVEDSRDRTTYFWNF